MKLESVKPKNSSKMSTKNQTTGEVPVISSNIRPSVAVITRTKNRNLLLKRAIQSVLNQTFEDWVHIIVNDGGDHSSVEKLVEHYRPAYGERLRIVHNELSLSMEVASNAGLALANSEYFIIHDDDDSWEPTFLEEMVGCLDSHGQDRNIGGAISYANVIMEDIEGDVVIEKSRHFFSDYQGLSFFSMMGRNWFPPICFLTRTAVLDKIGYFDGTLPVLGDWDFNKRLMRDFELVIYKKPLANYHHRDTAIGSFSNSVYGDSSKHEFFKTFLLDREIKDSLARNGMDIGLVSVLAMMTERINELQEEMKRLRADITWEIKNHIDWAHSQKGNE